MNFQLLFEGYQRTQILWKGSLKGLKQFQISKTSTAFVPKEPLIKLRLGKWVEQFMVHQIKQDNNCQLIADGLQIQKDKRTLGELDILLLKNSQPIHIECVYKFYLYDHTKTYKNELEYWIGPNRSDSLVDKLSKLQVKQLPLLGHPVTQVYLKELGYTSVDFEQEVLFKAQLFLPLKLLKVQVHGLNKNCIEGFHCNTEELMGFKDFKFYIPSKLEWLVQPHFNLNWMSFTEAYKTIKDQCKSHRSPMIWLKDPEDNLQKAFVTWW